MDRFELYTGCIDRFALRPGIGLFWRALRMLCRIGEGKNYRAVVNPRHRFNNFLVEGSANRAYPDNRGRLDALDSSDEIPRRRVLVCVRLLEIDKVFAARLQKAVDVEHVDPRLRFLEGQALCNQRGTKQVGKAYAGRTCAEEQVLFVFYLRALELGRINHLSESDHGCALHVILIDAVLIAVALEQMHGIYPRPVLEVNATLRE